ncbi:MAG: hypothetical protein M3158_00755 [Pseudomonadota bacterium]|nr:hypothetical protein [Pseudomonadota bacterium]
MATQPVMLPDHEPGCPVPLDTLGRLYRGDAYVLAETLQRLSDHQRARLAVFCNARQHLRDLGLRIAATCDEPTLVRVAGSAGSILFIQSRSPLRREDANPLPSAPAPRKVSLARLAWMD